MRNTLLFLIAFLLSLQTGHAQVFTAEDSLASGLIKRNQSTVISGYGEASYRLDTKRESAQARLDRVVLFLGHKFSKNISLFSELEIENAFVSGGATDEGVLGNGNLSMEQAFLKLNISPTTYIVAGLFIPRIGFINENHLPSTFNGVNRPFLEEQVIPATWREVGVGLYGGVPGIAGLNYSVSLTNGLNSRNFDSATGIRGGRQLGNSENGTNLGLSGSLLYYTGNFRLQTSAYLGGSTALEKRVADSLHLRSGPFGNAVKLGEINAQYKHQAWTMRAILAAVNVANAGDINKAFGNNAPETMYGAYAELAYDLLYQKFKNDKALILFGRYETFDLEASLPSNGIENPANRKQYFVGGLTYKPIRGVAIKADYVRKITGEFNQALIVTPFPQQVPYFKNNGFVDFGISYNF